MMRTSSSRLLKHEQTKLLRQTVSSVVIGLLVLILFVFVVMPATIRLFFRIIDGNSSKLAENSDTLPPQIPVLSLPYQATNSATVNLTGFGEAKSKVTVVVNSSPANTIDVAEDGTFSYELRLEQGDNSLVVFGTDAAGNESTPSSPYALFMDAEPLQIDISEPANNAEIIGRKNQSLLFKGKTKPGTKVFLNDRLNFVKADGSFELPYQLAEGENTIKVRGLDKAGNTTEIELKVTFKL